MRRRRFCDTNERSAADPSLTSRPPSDMARVMSWFLVLRSIPLRNVTSNDGFFSLQKGNDAGEVMIAEASWERLTYSPFRRDLDYDLLDCKET